MNTSSFFFTSFEFDQSKMLNHQIEYAPGIKEVEYYIKPGIVYLTGLIDQSCMARVCTDLQLADQSGQSVIPMVIHSEGGDLAAAIQIMECMHACMASVVTIVPSYAASAAVLLFSAGAKRYMGQHATLMIHEAQWYGIHNTISGVAAAAAASAVTTTLQNHIPCGVARNQSSHHGHVGDNANNGATTKGATTSDIQDHHRWHSEDRKMDASLACLRIASSTLSPEQSMLCCQQRTIQPLCQHCSPCAMPSGYAFASQVSPPSLTPHFSSSQQSPLPASFSTGSTYSLSASRLKHEADEFDAWNKKFLRLIAQNVKHQDVDYFIRHLEKRGNMDWYLSQEDALRHALATHDYVPRFRTRITMECTLERTNHHITHYNNTPVTPPFTAAAVQPSPHRSTKKRKRNQTKTHIIMG